MSLGKRGLKSIGTRFLYLKHLNLPVKLKLIRIIPHLDASYFDIDYVYDVDWIVQELKQNLVNNPSLLTNQDNILGIDLGLNNFTTCVGTGTRTGVNTSEIAFIVEGRGIKSQNRWYNKKLAKFQSQYDLHPSNRLLRKLVRLRKRRHDVMSNFIYNSVNFIVKHCLQQGITAIVVGDWQDMKRGLVIRIYYHFVVLKFISNSCQSIIFTL